MRFIFKPELLKSRILWIGFSAFLFLASISLVALRIYVGSQGRIDEALEVGLRVQIAIADGSVIGRVREKQSQNVTKQLSDENLLSEEDQSQELAVVDDFIGPRLPKKEVLKIEKVSLKELGDKPLVVVIVKGLGLSASTTETALDLPSEVTLGFSPYSPSIRNWAKKALSNGHEIILNIPMETRDFRVDDPGPYALLTSSSKDDNITRLKMLLSLVDGYRAIYSEKGEMFTQSIASVKPILNTLREQNTYFIFGGGYADFSLIQVANSLDYPLLVSDVTIDDDISAGSINLRLGQVEKIANEKGYAVAMAHPYPISVRMLEQWIPAAKKRGLKIVPVSLLLGKSFN